MFCIQYIYQSCDKVHIMFIQSDPSKSLSEITLRLNLEVSWYLTFIHSSINALYQQKTTKLNYKYRLLYKVIRNIMNAPIS